MFPTLLLLSLPALSDHDGSKEKGKREEDEEDEEEDEEEEAEGELNQLTNSFNSLKLECSL